MTDEEKRARRRRNSWLLVLAALTVMLAVIAVPPLLSIGRYKSQITRLVSSSLGRPVRLSSVELRLFPRPGFVLTDLSVDEDPAYGAEPLLHANTVTAAIRLLSLWRGQLEISSISVDEASLNVVRTEEGRWNLDPFFRTAAARTNGAAAGTLPPIPYLEATNSRVNIKKGLEKLPFSLVNADLSFWQGNPGDWRLRLRGQPARTDVSLDLADTGIVRLEATARHASEIRFMPIHMVMEWREAQLGQLSRLIIGSDPGWRGDLTGQFQLDGTAEAAQVKTRLSATNVHRAEFAPAEALDFDANCAFIYHYSNRSVENLSCDSPLGDGHIKVTGNLPGGSPANLSVAMQRIPVGAGLDILRTLRSGIDPDLDARGTLSGQLEYAPGAAHEGAQATVPKHRHGGNGRVERGQLIVPGPLQGSLVVDGFRLSGGALARPIQVAKVVWEPGPGSQSATESLGTTLSLPAGGSSPLTVVAHLSLSGYQIGALGAVGLDRIRDFSHLAGTADTSALDGLSGDSAMVDLNAKGPWLPSPSVSPTVDGSPTAASGDDEGAGLKHTGSDKISGTVVLHNAKWKSGVLANDVEISDATLHVSGEKLEWAPVEFQYGPVKGSASLQTFPDCDAAERCLPNLTLQFSELDAATLQTALLGAQKQDSAFSSLVARFTRDQTPTWPRLNGTIRADAIILGPVRLQNAAISFRLLPTEAEMTSADVGALGGQIHATGKVTSGAKPAYSFDGSFSKLTGQAFCQPIALQCAGGPIDGTGTVELSGFSAKDLATSASGKLHFEWHHGRIDDPSVQIPKELSRFDRWTADGTIANGTLTLTQNDLQRGAASAETEATVTFSDPPAVKVRIVAEGAAARK